MKIVKFILLPTKTLGLMLALAAFGAQAATIIPISVTVSSSFAGLSRSGMNMISGSGLDANLQHSTTPDGTMWVSAKGTAQTATFDLGANYNLTGMQIWNYNEQYATASGASNVVVAVASAMGGPFAVVDHITFAQATGLNTYTGDSYRLNAANVRQVRFTITSNYGSDVVGLSKVRFNGLKSSLTEPVKVSGVVTCPVGWIYPKNPILAPATKIGTWYELYWQARTNKYGEQHWRETRRKPLLGYYDSGDPAIIRAHFAQMKAAGIDYIIFDDTNALFADGGEIEENVAAIFATDTALPEAERMPAGFVIGAELYAGRSATGQQNEADHIWNNYAASPVYFCWRGKPLLVLFNEFDVTNCFMPEWSDPHFTVRKAVGTVVSSNALLKQYTAEGLWGWCLPEPQLASPETIAVGPGWTREHLPTPVHYPIEREGGARYMREWLFAIKHQPQNIVIPSWNEFAEETAIEPATATSGPKWADFYGDEVPDWYLQITSAYAHLRTGLMAGAYFRDEGARDFYRVVNGKLVLQSVMPHGHPVILLPAGTLSGLVSATK